MEYDERLKCAYWLTQPSGRRLRMRNVRVRFRTWTQPPKLWTVLSDENSEPSVERLLTVYKQATGIDIDALPLH